MPVLLEEDPFIVLFSVITTSANLIKQIYQHRTESLYYKETTLDYALKCITAKINWLPFKTAIKN